MKKLMTMLAAAAMAFGLYAEDAGFIAGADFEGNGNSYVNGAFVPGFWNGVGASVAEASYTATSRSAYYDKTANTNVLAVKTTLGNPVSHYLNTGKTGEKINAGLYFDAQVNFTVFDKDDTPAAAEGKLAVFLQLENDDDSKTNFIVRAAGPNNTTNDFVCADADLTPGWHRLTIKMIDNVYKTGAALVGFVVYVDGSPVSYTAANPFDTSRLDISPAIFNMNGQLFASLEGAADTISSVAFDGQGQVDEIVLTYDVTKVSFAGNKDGYVAKWNKDRVATIAIGGADATEAELAIGQKLIEGTPAGAVEVVWTAKTGYVSGNGSYNVVENVLDLENVVQEATVEVTIDEATTGLADLAAAVAAINGSANGGTIKLKGDQTVGAALETLTKDTVLDLNDQTITFTAATGTEALISLFTVANGVTLTIKDSGEDGEIVAETTSGYTLIAQAAEESTTAKFAVESGKMSGLFASYSWAAKGIAGGVFKAGEEAEGDEFYLAAWVIDTKVAKPSETVTGYWEIVDKPKDIDLANADIQLTAGSIVYGADAPAISSIKVNDVDVPSDAYTPSCNYTKDTSGIGTYKVTVTAVEGKGYTGSKDASFTVTAKALTVTGLSAKNKTYDSTTAAEIEGAATLDGVINEDDVKIANVPTAGTFADANAGTGKAVSFMDMTLTGEKAGNYTLTQPQLTADIAQAAVTVTADNKTIKVGDEEPTYTASVTAGEVYAGDTLDYTVDCPDYEDKEGYYNIVVTPGTNPNYAVTPANGTLTVEAASAPLPAPIQDGTEEQQKAYEQWAQKNGVTDDAAINAVAFALDVSVTDDIAADVQDALDDVLETEAAAAAEVAKFSADYTPVYFYITDTYPNAKFIFVETKEIESDNGKFFRLTAEFNSLK